MLIFVIMMEFYLIKNINLTPLHIAARDQLTSLFIFLLQRDDINVNCRDVSNDIFFIKFCFKKLMKFLLFLIYNLTPLHFIAQNGNIELANLLLNNKNVDINCLSVKLLLFHDVSIFFFC